MTDDSSGYVSKRVREKLKSIQYKLIQTQRAMSSSLSKTDDEDGTTKWLTVSDAARVADVSSGTITRAANNAKIKTNGQKGRSRRIDPHDLIRWVLDRSNATEQGESDKQVERLVGKNVKS